MPSKTPQSDSTGPMMIQPVEARDENAGPREETANKNGCCAGGDGQDNAPELAAKTTGRPEELTARLSYFGGVG